MYFTQFIIALLAVSLSVGIPSWIFRRRPSWPSKGHVHPSYWQTQERSPEP